MGYFVILIATFESDPERVGNANSVNDQEKAEALGQYLTTVVEELPYVKRTTVGTVAKTSTVEEPDE